MTTNPPTSEPAAKSSHQTERDHNMSTKKIKLTITEIENLKNDKPVVYTIKSASGLSTYVGIAQTGMLKARIAEHFQDNSNNFSGATVEIVHADSMEEAKRKESEILKNSCSYAD
ncbi:MAG: hypothetical protein KKE62_01755 [Proteobacteria bacterium]|nr:hypothetical protein [Pseudomonadota bacterium]MBU1387137.1 hypothetical protein [Pseudomonadota bacterium]MBU1541546.1 hypothetical protein [Pseudomonadota bacterium]MBU2430257.1 hypothetical protein [Pseudomonadota bacterium]MBU2480052.1 hypothetical protein [Pseudomonadota bacterium]